jgi:predicted amidophosphoribosyltransferase
MRRKSTVPSQPLVMPADLSAAGALRPEATKTCPHCAGSVAATAARCEHCGKDLVTAEGSSKDPWEGYDI